ncbi:glutathione S-transferase family protein [Jannaschia pohangensis]|uniref:Glutathione S-transferase n=1 Tax=Jannaschia pohangensis TaxID=390807 RepID=A0A1I3Q749_9RHOB|nr:glutathione S-transferase family protein [Jannaschia pohangensis]SFJ29191.1 glutathione S-transferase [Jannaschia pohangensis]
MSGVVLIGYGPSVYTRAVRLALLARGVTFDWRPVDPFDPGGAAGAYHPFGRVPVLDHGAVRIYETRAILTYVEQAFGGDEPADALTRARAAQVGSIADSYAYWPLVRQVFVEGVGAARRGDAPDAAALAEGMASAPRVLDALEEIAAEGRVLTGIGPGMSDWHLFPMIDLFRRFAPAARMLAERKHLAAWVESLSRLAIVQQTDPDLAEVAT